MARLDALQSRVNTIKSVLAKTPKKTDFGSKFIQKVAPLDIVVNVNPAVNSPHGLECLHRQLSSQFKVLTKSHVHSTATGTKCDLFKNSPLGTKDTRKDYQIIFTVIYTCATDDLTAFIGNSRLTGISSVTRFIGRILDIYPPQSKSKIIWIWQILLVILIHQRKRKWQTQRFWINTLERKSFVVMMPFRWQIMQFTRLLDRLMKRLVAKIFKHFVHEWKNF